MSPIICYILFGVGIAVIAYRGLKQGFWGGLFGATLHQIK